MTADYVLTPAALNDVDDIHAFIEERYGPEFADSVVDRLYGAFGKISAQPGLGHRRQDLTEYDVYFWNAFDHYAVVYQKSAPLRVVRVIPWRLIEGSIETTKDSN